MGYNDEHLPNEAEMDLKDFGPKQVRNYILDAVQAVFYRGRDNEYGRITDPEISIEEDGTMTVNIFLSKIRMRKMDNGLWHYVLNDDITQVRVFKAKDVFKMIEGVLGAVLHNEFQNYLMSTYDCVA